MCCVQNYNEAQLQHQEWMNKQRKEAQVEESHEETLKKIENTMQEHGESSQFQAGKSVNHIIQIVFIIINTQNKI